MGGQINVANGLNQFTPGRGVGFAYDARGNMSSDGVNAYGYDILNRLISRGSATLGYDPAGRLYQSVAVGVTTRMLYDGAAMIGEYNASNALQRRFVHGPGMDEPLVWYEGSGTSDRRWLLADERGSIVAVTNAAGAATNINTYDEYGVPGASNVGRFQNTGQMWLSEVGVYHYKNRAYAPALGRFLQTDPIGTAGGVNLYAYVGGDPVNFTDTWGLEKGEKPIVVTGLPCAAVPECMRLRQERLRLEAERAAAQQWLRNMQELFGLGHDYTVTNKVCNAALGPAAQVEALGSAAYPGQNPYSQVQSGQFYIVTDPRNGLPGGIVRSTVSNRGFTVTNVTTPLHVFAGRVDRTISANAAGTYITTHGVGTSPGIVLPPPVPPLLAYIPGPVLDAINQSQGPELFNAVDAALAERLAESNPAC